MASVPMRTSGHRRGTTVLLMFGVLSLVLYGCGAVGSAQSSSRVEPSADERAPTATRVLAPHEESTRVEDPPVATADVAFGDGLIDELSPLSAFDDNHPAIANLEPGLRAAVQQAALDAAAEGVDVLITSGWRSERYQRLLLDEAIASYGNLDEARKWVSTPERSAHVKGNAVDIGATDAAYWFSQFGSRYGLCQAYANEIWHYELRVDPGGRCPDPAANASAS